MYLIHETGLKHKSTKVLRVCSGIDEFLASTKIKYWKRSDPAGAWNWALLFWWWDM